MRVIKSGVLLLFVIFIAAMLLATSGCTESAQSESAVSPSSELTITDGYGRQVTVPENISSVVCSAGGPCVRCLAYMDAVDKLAGADSGDKPSNTTTRDTRSYTLANPQFANLTLIGSANNDGNLETIMMIKPDIIFMMGSASNLTNETVTPADTMQSKTGIPVISLSSGSYTTPEGRIQLYNSYRIIGKVLGKEARAEELIGYIEETLADFEKRTKDIPESEQKTAFIGGLSHGGSHGLLSTQSAYPPFAWLHIKNILANGTLQSSDISKEGLLQANPDFIFIDAGTLGVQDEISGVDDIKTPVFSEMKAIKNGDVYATLPFNYRSSNLDTILADTYFIGKTVYPDRFADIDPKVKADEIYQKFVGKPVFAQINANCQNLGFEKVPLA